MIGTLRENWRVVLLTVMLVVSLAALFVPQATLGEAGGGGEGPTNLQYGIELDGGTRISAPVVGVTAEGVELGDANDPAIRQAVADAFGDRVEAGQVAVQRNARDPNLGPTVEVFVDGVTPEDLGSALQSAGYEFETVRDGVTANTRASMVDAIDDKISEAGFGGGSVRVADTGDSFFVVVEAPGRDAEELRDTLSRRGVVQLDAYYPNESGAYVNETLLTSEQLENQATIGPVEFQEGDPVVPVTLSDAIAGEFADDMVAAGFGSGTRCMFNGYGNPDNQGRCLLTVLDGEVVYDSGVRPDLGESFRDGSFTQRPQFFIEAENRSVAQTLRLNLRAGALPAPLDFQDGTTISVDPALAERFKGNSLVTGLIAVLAVSLVVYLRYDDLRVAAPMVVTALSEVVILLGFAAAVGYALDLSVIAGFIAVIGTGVDDLVIIADEVLSEGEVSSNRVFRSRFRKAFWVIGAAAATTIIAMSPLAYLSLGALRGFAIITILGVLVGVLVTRPAYGDILRSLMTER
jgi:preprotein translocase subunit SecD